MKEKILVIFESEEKLNFGTLKEMGAKLVSFDDALIAYVEKKIEE